jgi:tetratricopeptide (TPR) repeat protein
MPRRQAKDGGHTAFTDHRIQRRPEADSTLPENTDIAAWREPAPELEKRNLGIAYVNAGMERHSPSFIVRGYRLLTEVQQQFSNDSEIFTSMGTALLAGNQTTEAELAFERALQLNPGSATGETNAASAYLQAGDSEKAIAHLERAINIDPLHLAAAAPLMELYKQQGDAAKASELSESLNALVHKPSAESEVTRQTSLQPQLAAAAFKNIQVLKTIPSDQLRPAMRFISASLGVECNYCHVEGAFEKDDKKPKQIAREMMRMTFAIDNRSFARSRQVTCYSCHRGSTKPEATPAVASGERSKPTTVTADSNPLPEALPTADQAIARYVQALGGDAAIERITSLHETGTTTGGSKSVRLEVWDEYPDKQISVRHLAAGDAETILSGSQGWTRAPGRPARELDQADLEAAQIDADLHFPLRLRQLCAELRMEYPEELLGHAAYLISCADVGKPPLKLYFDEHTGLLVRLVRYLPTPLGLVPSQIDYGDYRPVGGVNIPFRWTVAEANRSTTTQLEEIEQNVPVDERKFARPESLSAAQAVGAH